MITRDLGNGPPQFRCCLASATADPVTGQLYATWNSVTASKVKLSSSTDGKHWSDPVVVNRPDPSLLGVNADVSAYNGTVAVSYGLTNADTTTGRFGRQFIATSRDAGRHFLTPTAIGPQINYAYAARAGGIFPGDYIGSAMTKGRLYAVWAVSSTPPSPGARYHQVIDGAVLDTNRSPVQAAAAPPEAAAVMQPLAAETVKPAGRPRVPQSTGSAGDQGPDTVQLTDEWRLQLLPSALEHQVSPRRYRPEPARVVSRTPDRTRVVRSGFRATVVAHRHPRASS